MAHWCSTATGHPSHQHLFILSFTLQLLCAFLLCFGPHSFLVSSHLERRSVRRPRSEGSLRTAGDSSDARDVRGSPSSEESQRVPRQLAALRQSYSSTPEESKAPRIAVRAGASASAFAWSWHRVGEFGVSARCPLICGRNTCERTGVIGPEAV